jgi:hypothetical protein
MSSNRLRILLLSLFAVFAVSAVAASSASATGWWVCKETTESPIKEPPTKYDNSLCNTQTKPLAERRWQIVAVAAGESFEFSDIETVAGATSRVVFHGGAITVECPEISFVNALGEETGESNPNPPDTMKSEALMTGTNGGSIHQVQFSGCVVTTNPPLPGCALAPTGEDDISTSPIAVSLSTTTPTVTLTPSGTTTFATFKLNAACETLAGEYKVKGSTAFTISEPESCKEVHKITIAEDTKATNKLEIGGEKVEKFDIVRNLEGVESDRCWDVK